MQVKIKEIQNNIFQITLRPPGSVVSFSHFVIKDEMPAIIHTGHQKTFEDVFSATAKILDPQTIKYITFSHFEPDECGSLNQWLSAIPGVKTCLTKICSWSVQDSSIRPVEVIKNGEAINLGKHKLMVIETPHFPHAWEACLFYDPYTKVLFGSDIGTQKSSSRTSDAHDLSEEILDFQLKLGYTSFGEAMAQGLQKLKSLDISTLATMHGSPLNKKNTKSLFELLETKNLEVCSTIAARKTIESNKSEIKMK